jgi:hypothetical protein
MEQDCLDEFLTEAVQIRGGNYFLHTRIFACSFEIQCRF